MNLGVINYFNFFFSLFEYTSTLKGKCKMANGRKMSQGKQGSKQETVSSKELNYQPDKG